MSEVRQRRRPSLTNGWAEAIRNMPSTYEHPAAPIAPVPAVKPGRRQKRTQPRETEWHSVTLHDAFSDACVMGFDLSLTSTGMAVFAERLMMSRALDSDPLRGPARLAWFYEQFLYWIKLYKPALVVLEGYAYDAKFGREAAGELGGVMRLVLHQTGTPWISYQPGQHKKFAIGQSQRKVDKNLVARELYKRYGVDAEGNDEVDACGLALMGAAHLGFRVLTTVAQREAVAKVEE